MFKLKENKLENMFNENSKLGLFCSPAWLQSGIVHLKEKVISKPHVVPRILFSFKVCHNCLNFFFGMNFDYAVKIFSPRCHHFYKFLKIPQNGFWKWPWSSTRLILLDTLENDCVKNVLLIWNTMCEHDTMCFGENSNIAEVSWHDTIYNHSKNIETNSSFHVK